MKASPLVLAAVYVLTLASIACGPTNAEAMGRLPVKSQFEVLSSTFGQTSSGGERRVAEQRLYESLNAIAGELDETVFSKVRLNPGQSAQAAVVASVRANGMAESIQIQENSRLIDADLLRGELLKATFPPSSREELGYTLRMRLRLLPSPPK